MSRRVAESLLHTQNDKRVGFKSERGVIHWEGRTPGLALCGARLGGDYCDDDGATVECVVCVDLAGKA